MSAPWFDQPEGASIVDLLIAVGTPDAAVDSPERKVAWDEIKRRDGLLHAAADDGFGPHPGGCRCGGAYCDADEDPEVTRRELRGLAQQWLELPLERYTNGKNRALVDLARGYLMLDAEIDRLHALRAASSHGDGDAC